MKLIANVEEAILYKDGDKIIKERISKSYRIKEIDTKLRKERTRMEARILEKLARARVNVPRVLKVDEAKTTLEIEEIKGEKVRDYLLKSKDTKIFRQIAEQVELMHSAGIVHGDLTTSNMILSKNKIFLIDFGLSGHSDRVEDKAVDLHLLKECLKSKHFEIWEPAWKVFEKNYGIGEVINRLKVVERRGRYKEKAPI
ncbi:MAG: KEOPS complex kinase/ATPase Bud32 [DPANN group archaeon]|nr:KEOPS complex kinase/ATPase Bud32 [DPANN group archaeon]